MKTQAEFYLENAVNGELTDAQTMQMLNLPEGDITADPVKSSEQPDAAGATANEPEGDVKEVVEPPASEPAKQPEPPTTVVLAKDGVHTIPYAELERARGAERTLADQLAQAQAQLTALQATPTPAKPDPQAPQAPATGEYEIDLGDFSEDAIKNGIRAAIEAGVSAKTAELMAKVATLEQAQTTVQQQSAETEEQAHFGAIRTAHPDIESIVGSQELSAWLKTQPSYVRNGITAAIEGGTAAEVIEAIDTYKAATGKTATTPTPANPGVDHKAMAAAAIANARSKAPTSLSDIPAGHTAPHDEAAAMLEMSPEAVMTRFSGVQTPEQIMALMDKIL